MDSQRFKTINEANKVSLWYSFARYLLLFVTGTLLILGFPAFNYYLIAWLGIIPLYLLVRDLRWQQAFIGGYVWGYGWSLASIYWLKTVEPFIPFALSLVLAFFYAMWSVLIPMAHKYLILRKEKNSAYGSLNYFFKEFIFVLFLASYWCVLEWLRTWIFSGLPWNLLAISQWQQIGLIQISSITGIYGVSFILVFFNISLANLLNNFYLHVTIKKNVKFIPLSFYIVMILLISSFWFGVKENRKIQNAFSKNYTTIKTAVVQGNIPQCRYYNEHEAKEALRVYYDYSDYILHFNPELIIWPESAVPQPLRGWGKLSEEYMDKVTLLINKYKVPILIGTIDFDFDHLGKDGEPLAYNSALYLNKNGEIVEKYNKIHVIPWGEYTPGENLFPLKYIYPWIKKTFGMGRSLTAGKENTIFDLKDDVRGAVLICYEDVYPNICRGHVLNGANLLITITNDAWYPVNNELEQHLAQSVFRAVENNRPLLRVGNNGGTCVIQPNGFISDSLFHKRFNLSIPDPGKQGRGATIFNVKVEKNPLLTFYTKHGNLFILFCGIISLLIFLWIIGLWNEYKTSLIEIIGTKTL